MTEESLHNREIWRIAYFLIRRHGADAETVAMRLAEDPGRPTSAQARAMWRPVINAIRKTNAQS
jgi:hypothetical protein